MAFRVSPGVSIKEIDLTTIVPAVATTPGGFAGYFHWGPVDEIVTVTSQTELANIFGKPQNDNYVDFFTAGNFLSYGNNCQTVRVVGAAAKNATVTKAGVTGVATLVINNETNFGASAGLSASTPAVAGVLFAAKYPGALGNSLKVVVTNGSGTTGASLAYAASLGATYIDMFAGLSAAPRYFAVGDEVVFSDGTTVTVSSVAKASGAVPSTTSAYNSSFGAGLTGTFGDIYGLTTGWNAASSAWGSTFAAYRLYLSTLLPKDQPVGTNFTIKSVYAKYVASNATTTTYASDSGGSNDLVNVLVLDKAGLWTGTQNSLLEKFDGLSRAFDARNFDGSSNYYRTVVNDQSAYVWALQADLATNGASAANVGSWLSVGPALATETAVGGGVNSLQLTGGASATPTDSERWANGWSKFADADLVDVSLLPLGNASATLAQLVIQNVCEKRLDCMAFVSPGQTDVENKLPYEALNAIKTFRDSTFNLNSSYAVLDSGWKYQLDTFNNLLRVMPLNADIAGLVARTEFTNEAWFSPAGFNRGQVKGVVKLAYNPSSEAHRDELYTRQVNPVVSFPGEGVILFGDKTMQTRPSAFDRINVRRLFIILEKAIATASKFFLFEQNDSFTRAQFKNLVVPFLKTVQQRRGITDFKVVCDETNNTGEVIDRNEFVADIFIKPTRSINFIQLNFVATSTGVDFNEVGG
jgi:phage tail sheath protein FI